MELQRLVTGVTSGSEGQSLTVTLSQGEVSVKTLFLIYYLHTNRNTMEMERQTSIVLLKIRAKHFKLK